MISSRMSLMSLSSGSDSSAILLSAMISAHSAGGIGIVLVVNRDLLDAKLLGCQEAAMPFGDEA